ncbi:IniB N-terminal domain-containing protein [Pseudonocardia acaciae]|uniref:IniB N-terminal domain-containing protein n=1 Tax=Pseudonocardia acaciae TaxID=551276 RepID=UPI00048AC815|nr:IniB N-terminal domain-containing protein [Pseudonocardia acaciae]
MATPLMSWIEGLLRDPDAREAFLADPDGYAEDHGFRNVSSADVQDALSLIADDNHSNFSQSAHFPPPRHSNHHSDDGGAHYLRGYFEENQKAIERHETELDNSVDQDIDTGRGHHDHYYDHDGNFDQVVDNDPVLATGDGSVGTGGTIADDTVTSGDANLVGQGDQAVTGNHNSTAFGTGEALGTGFQGVRFDDGGALGVRGDTYTDRDANDTDTAVRNSGSGDNAVNSAGDHGYADQQTDQTYNDTSVRSEYEDATRTDTHEQTNSHNDTSYRDSHDTIEVHHP